MIKILRRRKAYLLFSGSLLLATVYLLGTRGNVPPSYIPVEQVPVSRKKVTPPPEVHTQKPLTVEFPALNYGTNALPPLKDFKSVVDELPAQYLPSLGGESDSSFAWTSSKKGRAKRLIFVGDVHGQLSALQALLKKVEFDQDKGDHLVLTGDLVNKGPDSAAVVQLAMDLGASAVRGNHEDRLLLVNKAMKRPDKASTSQHTKVHEYGGGTGGFFSSLFGFGGNKPKFTVTELTDDDKDVTKWDGEDGEPNLEQEPSKGKESKGPEKVPRRPSHGDEAFRALAATMSAEQIDWLEELPIILRIGRIPGAEAAPASGSASNAPWNNEIVVVHAGLVPRIPLKKQDPWVVMHIRSLSYPADSIRRETVQKYLVASARRKNLGRPAYIAPTQVDNELDRLKGKLPQEVFEQGRDVAVPSEGRDGTSWSDVWNEVQNNDIPEEHDRMTVIYGHDAKGGLNADMKIRVKDKTPEALESIEKEEEAASKGWWSSWWSGKKEKKPEVKTRPGTRYAFGLDSGCVYGKQLTALVLEAGLEGKQGIVHKVFQVNCDMAVDPDKESKKSKETKKSKERKGR